jgi:hypothetical protein
MHIIYKYIYLSPIASYFFTIFRETIVLLAQKLYAFWKFAKIIRGGENQLDATHWYVQQPRVCTVIVIHFNNNPSIHLTHHNPSIV